MVGSMYAASGSKRYYQLFLLHRLIFRLAMAFVYPLATTISRQYLGSKHWVVNGLVVSGGAMRGFVLPYAVRGMISSYGLIQTFKNLRCIAIAVLVTSIALLRPKTQIRSMSRLPPLVHLSLLSSPIESLLPQFNGSLHYCNDWIITTMLPHNYVGHRQGHRADVGNMTTCNDERPVCSRSYGYRFRR